MTMMDFTMTVESLHSRPVSRQSEEGLLITSAARKVERGEKLYLMNSKSKFYQPGVVRVSYSRAQ